MTTHLGEAELKVFIDLSLGYFTTVTGTAAQANPPRIEFSRPEFSDFTGVVTLGGIADGCVYLTLGRRLLEDLLRRLGEPDLSTANCLDLAGEITNTIASNARGYFGQNLTISVPSPYQRAAAEKLPMPPTRFVLPLKWNNHPADLVIALRPDRTNTAAPATATA